MVKNISRTQTNLAIIKSTKSTIDHHIFLSSPWSPAPISMGENLHQK